MPRTRSRGQRVSMAAFDAVAPGMGSLDPVAPRRSRTRTPSKRPMRLKTPAAESDAGDSKVDWRWPSDELEEEPVGVHRLTQFENQRMEMRLASMEDSLADGASPAKPAGITWRHPFPHPA